MLNFTLENETTTLTRPVANETPSESTSQHGKARTSSVPWWRTSRCAKKKVLKRKNKICQAQLFLFTVCKATCFDLLNGHHQAFLNYELKYAMYVLESQHFCSKWKHQLDATILSILFHIILLSTCFGCYTHPSSGASNMYNQVWYNLITV